MVMVMVMLVMVVMVVMRRTGHRSGRRRRLVRRRGGFLGNGVSRQANGENGGAYETLDHGKAFLLAKGPRGSSRGVVARCA
jgi:uncharacterized membrane protein YqiK